MHPALDIAPPLSLTLEAVLDGESASWPARGTQGAHKWWRVYLWQSVGQRTSAASGVYRRPSQDDCRPGPYLWGFHPFEFVAPGAKEGVGLQSSHKAARQLASLRRWR